MEYKVQIRDRKRPKTPRIFDVTVDERGNILRYDIQNLRGAFSVDGEDVRGQIRTAIQQHTERSAIEQQDP